MACSTQKLVDFAYGPNADFYKDVLQVSREASQADIQSAFIDRRYELYELLQNPNTPTDPTSPNKSMTTGRSFNEKKMDALVATFRILYDPVKRLEYNAKSNTKKGSNIDKHSKDASLKSSKPTKQTESKVEKHVMAELKDVNSRNLRASRFKKQAVTKHSRQKKKLLDLKTPKAESDDSSSGKDVPPVPRKRNNSKSKSGSSKSNIELFPDESSSILDQHQSSNVNISNVSLRNTYEQIQKQVEQSSQQQTKNIKARTGSSRRTSRQVSDSSSYDQSKESIDNVSSSRKKSRLKSQVTWEDDESYRNNGRKRNAGRKTFDSYDLDNIDEESMASTTTTTTTEVYGCLNLNHVEHPTDIVESGTLVGFLRSSGFETQAYLVQELGNEVRGSIADTILAVDQVFNAFRINDDDIDAVVGNISNERKCLANELS